MAPHDLTPVTPGRPRRHPKLRRAGLVLIGIAGVMFAAGAIGNAVSPARTAAVSSSPAAASGTAHAAPRAAHKAAAAPAPTVTVTAAPKPAVTVTAPPRAKASPASLSPADVILARFSGTGTGNTGTFTVPLSGVWHLSWAYANGQLFAGQPENFQVYEYDADSGALVDILVNELAVGTGTPHADPVYDSAEAGGRVYFKVVTEDATWSLVPVSGES